MALVQLLVKVRVNGFQVRRELREVVGIEGVRIDIEVLQPGHELVARQRYHFRLDHPVAIAVALRT